MRYLLLLLMSVMGARGASVSVACTAPAGPALKAVAFYVATNSQFTSATRVTATCAAGQTITNRLTNLVSAATNWITASAISSGDAEGDTCTPISVWVPAKVTLGTVPVELSAIQLPPNGGVVSVSRDLVLWNERLEIRTNNLGMTLKALAVADQPQLFLWQVPPTQRSKALLPRLPR